MHEAEIDTVGVESDCPDEDKDDPKFSPLIVIDVAVALRAALTLEQKDNDGAVSKANPSFVPCKSQAWELDEGMAAQGSTSVSGRMGWARGEGNVRGRAAETVETQLPTESAGNIVHDDRCAKLGPREDLRSAA